MFTFTPGACCNLIAEPFRIIIDTSHNFDSIYLKFRENFLTIFKNFITWSFPKSKIPWWLFSDKAQKTRLTLNNIINLIGSYCFYRLFSDVLLGKKTFPGGHLALKCRILSIGNVTIPKWLLQWLYSYIRITRHINWSNDPIQYPHGTEYCRNMSEIFPIFHCKRNIVAKFLSNIAKYFIATFQF